MNNENNHGYPEFIMFVLGVCILLTEDGKRGKVAAWLRAFAMGAILTSLVAWALWA